MSDQNIQDILGIGQTKLGYFQEWQIKLLELRDAHAESERQRLSNLAILEGITDLMMVLSEDLRILSVNRIFEEFFPGRKATGEYCYTLFRNANSPCPECPAFLCLLHNTTKRESAIFQLSGRNLHFDMVASPLPHASDKGRSVLIFKRDVTREKQLQAQIYQAEKMASIGTLAAGVAHEINNPLTAIAGFAEGIHRRIPRLPGNTEADLMADLTEYTDTILRECKRCRDIVQALANFSRPQQHLRKLVNLTAVIAETLSLLHHTLRQYDRVFFCLDLAPDLPEIWADDTQVRQMLLNLVTNAIDALTVNGFAALPPTGGVTIRTLREAKYIIMQVEDTGTGIAPQHLTTVFEPFFTTKPKGLGLGLSICYNAVQSHGGNISLVNDPGGRTLATVRLPIQPATPQHDKVAEISG